MVTSDVLKTFGAAVRAARSAAGLTLAQLAEEAFKNPHRKGYVSQIEHGRKQITALTVGKLAEALDLPDSVTGPMYANDAPTEETFDDTDERAEALLSTAEREGSGGVAEALMIGLAYDYAEGDTPDLDTAYRGLRAALETAREMGERAALPDNTDAGISAVRAEVQRLNEGDEREAARDAIAEAIAKKTAEMTALLDLGVQQDRILNDPAAAAEKLVEQARLEGKASFAELRALQDVWYERGRDGGLAFEATVAIHLAQASLAQAKKADERWAALVVLGNAVQVLGARESGTARLEVAVAAYRAALEEYTRERVPLDWAMTQNNLGTALSTLGERESGTARLEQAVAAYRAALEERTRERVPLDWAMTQNNLGTALWTLGTRESKTARLEEAVAAYRAALEERTRDRVPLNWAGTQNNLGTALHTLGERESGTARLKEAVAAYRAALEEYTRDRVPLDWAMTQNNLGNALQTLGERESGTARLEEAVAAYRAALEERTRDRVPLDWAMTHGNLANVHAAFFQKNNDSAHLDEAETYAMVAKEVFVEAGASQYVELIDKTITKIQSLRP